MPCANIAYVKAPTESDFPVCSDNWRCDGGLSDCVTGKRKGRVYFTHRHTHTGSTAHNCCHCCSSLSCSENSGRPGEKLGGVASLKEE